MSLDSTDRKLLRLLQDNSSQSNAELGEAIGLSQSQVSRRRAGLEEAGYIRGYRADLDPRKLGAAIEVFVRVRCNAHNEAAAEDFAQFLIGLDEVQEAHSITGETDYLVHIRVGSLDELADFVHRKLLPHPNVQQVRSDIVLRTIKQHVGFRLPLKG